MENNWKQLKIVENKLNKIIENYWEHLKVIENNWKQLKTIENNWKQLKTIENNRI